MAPLLAGTAIAIVFVLALAGAVAEAGQVSGVPLPVPPAQDSGVISRIVALDEGDDGRTVLVPRGETITVRLRETDPAEAWQFEGGGQFRLLDEVMREAYPAQHVFRIKALGSGDLVFRKTADRSGVVLDTFRVRVKARERPNRTEWLPNLPIMRGSTRLI